eukprot:CAMPEP_0119301080 /NCGR_PEP_ID=MMETSP1333-20130426/2923_1 /TAXON_ID=418940 /ORGANISM="Scyphosphaera apsteinii, Strain RCC1455" /LENGTH=300 /DNA_ID=CAMNT_0007303055 /DNA_START=16 /DNA_END=918 /DNA_ORIENTATION=-
MAMPAGAYALSEEEIGIEELWKKLYRPATMSKHLKYFEIPEQDYKEFFEEEPIFQCSEEGLNDEDCLKLANAMRLKKPEQLRSLYVHKNDYTDEGFAHIVKALPYVPGMEILYAAQNNLTAVGMKAFSALAGTDGGRGVKQLTLNRCKLESAGLKELAINLKGGALPNLEWLWLSENDIGDEGVIELGDNCLAQGACPKLARLALQTNQVGDDGLKALARAVSKGAMKEQGEYIYVMENRFTEDGRRALLQGMEAGAEKRDDCILQAHFGWPPPLSLVDIRREKGLKGPPPYTGGSARIP